MTVASTATSVAVQGQLDEPGRASLQAVLHDTIARLQQALEGDVVETVARGTI